MTDFGMRGRLYYSEPIRESGGPTRQTSGWRRCAHFSALCALLDNASTCASSEKDLRGSVHNTEECAQRAAPARRTQQPRSAPVAARPPWPCGPD